MTPRRPALLIVLALGIVSAAQAADRPEAGDRCEAAVADAIRTARGKDVQDVQFSGAHRVMSAGDHEEIGVKGEGRYRARAGTVGFSYTCAYSASTGKTSGVLFRETGGPGAGAVVASDWQPDLLNLNPVACETAVATVLKDRYPRVEGINFNADSRRLRPATQGRTAMDGQGRLQRAPGMAARGFRYSCEFERGSARVARADARD